MIFPSGNDNSFLFVVLVDLTSTEQTRLTLIKLAHIERSSTIKLEKIRLYSTSLRENLMKSLTVRFSSSPVPLHDDEDVVDVFNARKASRHRPLVFFGVDVIVVVVVVVVEVEVEVEFGDVVAFAVVVVVADEGLVVKRFDDDDVSPSR